MKFKVGDTVKHGLYGLGEIVYINTESEDVLPYAVVFETFNKQLNNLGICGAPIAKYGHGWWCREEDLKLDKQQPKNLIPLIIKELGVEIGEEFYIRGWSSYLYKFEDNELLSKTNCNEYKPADDEDYTFLITNKNYKIEKLPQRPKLSYEEYIVLKNIDKRYKWMAKDIKHKHVHLYVGRPKKQITEWNDFNSVRFQSMWLFGNLFKFVSFDDEEPYNIQSLLDEYEKYDKEK